MKATGEVMAIDRTFGSALKKALRGLEQAGVGPLAEDDAWRPTMGYLAGVYAGDPDADEPITWVDETGQACESTRHAQRAAAPIVLRQFLEPSDSRLWRILGLMRRGVPEAIIGGATGIAPWFLAEMGRNVALEAEVSAAGTRLADPGDAAGGRAARDGQAGRVSATASWPTWPARPQDEIRARPRWPRPPPGLHDGRHLRRGVRRRDAVLLRDLRRRRVAPEAPPVTRPAALVIGSGPIRIGQGIEFDYCSVQAAGTLRGAGWSAVMINSNPETVSTDFDASTRLYFEPLDPESVRNVIDAESPDGGDLLPAVVASTAARRRSTSPRRSRAGGVPLLGSDLETIDQAEERTRFSALLDRLGIPQPEGGMAHSVEEALTLAERIGYPVIVRPSFVIGGLAIDFCYSPSDLARQLAAATVVDARSPGPDRPLPRGRRGRRRRRLRTASGC